MMIRVNQLFIRYAGRLAVQDVSFTATSQSITALVGPSGCGKTSVLGSINRMTERQPGAQVTGQVMIGDQDIYAPTTAVMTLRRRVGMIFQRPNPFAMSIEQNIHLAPHAHWGLSRTALQQLTERVLCDVGLWDEVKDRLRDSALTLSGGQQQRLCIARALALQPEVLLMDEPCSSLDPQSMATVEALIRQIGKQCTVLMVTHNLAQARRLADQMVVFWHDGRAGRVVESGATESLFAAAQCEQTRAYLAGFEG